ncbi:ABC transporter permease [Streptococcus infantis]|jgi:hypothetical protein|uniref:ABC transporter permease n=1 Tax=Streptococcus infantis TaxID=68892 RepID=UPI003567717B
MKKKPIYLWVLLIFSALLSAMSLFGIISPVPTAESMGNIETSGVDATYAKELIAYTIKAAEHSHSIINIILVILSAILVVVALIFLVRKNIQLANYTYIGYVFLAILGSIYNFVGVQDALSLFTDPNVRMGAELGAKGSTIFGIVLNVIFLAIVFYKIWQQQKELTESQEEELA